MPHGVTILTKSKAKAANSTNRDAPQVPLLPEGVGVLRHERLVDDPHQRQPRLQVIDADEDGDAREPPGEDSVAGLHIGRALDVLMRGI